MFSLAGYISPIQNPPSFVIPIFSRVGTNEVFVQNLLCSGEVEQFKLVNCDIFYPVHVMAPVLKLREGDPGLLAYWAEPSRVILGSSDSISDALAGEFPSEPFVELEIGTLVGSRDRVADAARSIAMSLANDCLAARWEGREISTFDRRVEISRGASARAKQIPDKSDALIKSLLSNPTQSRWASIWMDVWRERRRRKELEQIALWWIESGYAVSEDCAPLLGIMSRRPHTPRVAQFALDWLKLVPLTARNWPSLWSDLRSNAGAPSSVLNSLGLAKLQENIGPFFNWFYMWSLVWKNRFDRDGLIFCACEIFERHGTTNKYFGEYVLVHLSKLEDYPSTILIAHRQWLDSNIRSNLTWISIFLNLYARFPDQGLVNLGRSWLSFCGGNTNRWIDVWRAIKDNIAIEDSVELAIEWLERSRWDLSSWPAFFVEITMPNYREVGINRMINLGRRWLHNQGLRKNMAMVEDAVRYLEAMRDAGEQK
jgi:hypothetical protein